ncbi:hypothetical protein JKP88DRAFT_165492, partial [Tribonema minus]
MLVALAPVRDQYLLESLARLTKPVEQMFLHHDGYMAAVPSKHDLASFVKAMQAEAAVATDAVGGHVSLAPLVMRGAAKAVKLFCSKVSRLLASRSVRDRANWAKTADQTHNMQLLTLITQLRTAVVQLPSIVKPGKPAQKGLDPEEVTQCAQEASTHVDAALKAIDALATGQILRPYLSAAAYALERVMGTMHKDSFANLEGGSAEQTSGASAYMLDLQRAVGLVQSEHLKTVAALNAPYAQEMLRCLTDRLVRSFVSHAALVRPMEEAGKLKMARDMAMLEMCLSGIAPVATLGASYAEL